MKNFKPLLPLLLLVSMTLAGCYYVEPYPPGPGHPGPGYPHPGPPPIGGPLPGRPGWTAGQIAAFEEGRSLGREDARRGRSANFDRYDSRFSPVHRPYAREGYRVGYEESDRPGPPSADGPREEFYERGYDRGRSDYRRGLRHDPSRYSGEYSVRWKYFFESGYDDGYSGRPPREPRGR